MHTGHISQSVNEIRVVALQADLQIQFHFAFLGGLALDHSTLGLGIQNLHCTCFAGVVGTADDNDVRIYMSFSLRKYPEQR